MNTAKKNSRVKIVIGIDEAGRGPLAGPVSVGVCAILDLKRAKKIFKGVKESKQLNEKAREEWFLKMEKTSAEGVISFAVQMTSAKVIDEKGISFAIKSALQKALYKVVEKFDKTHKTSRSSGQFAHLQILLDGGLRAPAEFVNQKTIIKGDEKEMSIALASIGAKVFRDRYMQKLAKKEVFKKYQFEVHKGYGTEKHRKSILKYGLSDEHRISFCSGLIPVNL